VFDWTNYQGFLNAALSWNPRSDMLFKFSAGAGYEDAVMDGLMKNSISGRSYSDDFEDIITKLFGSLPPSFGDSYEFDTKEIIKESDLFFNAQGRVDWDWELGEGFLAAAGVQEMYTQLALGGDQLGRWEKWLSTVDNSNEVLDDILGKMGITDIDDLTRAIMKNSIAVNMPATFSPDAGNRMFTTSGYALAEYGTEGGRFGAELGLRVDHYYLWGKGFSAFSKPALNPRLNMDFTVFRNKRFIEAMELSAGTGLFSSMTAADILMAEEQYNITEIQPDRSWTSVVGARLEFFDGLSLNIEGYYKYIFDRMYIPVKINAGSLDIHPRFNGEGKVWGIDLMLQKTQSRYFDGWISYSYNWANYREPDSKGADMNLRGETRGGEWYFPNYHRFHNLNLIVNIKPSPRINIYTRFGYASGTQIVERITSGPETYPVYMYYGKDNPDNKFIEKYRWRSQWNGKRSTATFPLDIKFSFYGKNKKGRAQTELYVAVENALVLLYHSKGNASYNSYTGRIEEGNDSANFEMPIPIPSFGFKVSY
jgi:hypothetical protein